MNPRVAFPIFVFVFAAFLLNVSPGHAQEGPGDEQGILPSRTYHGTNLEEVNVGNGRVVLHIPLLEDHSQRGQLNFTYSLSLTSSGNWFYKQFTGFSQWQLPKTPLGVQFIMDGRPQGIGSTIFHDTSTGVENSAGFVIDADGAKHSLAKSITGSTFTETFDGSGLQSSLDSSGTSTITNRKGVSFHLGTTLLVEDSNGNQMTRNPSGALTDTLGRTWTTTGGSS